MYVMADSARINERHTRRNCVLYFARLSTAGDADKVANNKDDLGVHEICTEYVFLIR